MMGSGSDLTNGSERRVAEPRRPGPTLVTDTPGEPLLPIADTAVLGELKERIRAVLMTRIDPSVAGHDLVVIIDEHRIAKSKPLNAVGDLAYLLLRVPARVA